MQLAMVRKPLVSVILLCFCLCGSVGLGQQTKRTARSTMKRQNRQIAEIVREIDARRIEQTIRTLVGFGTRNTLSTQNDPKRGIGAAADWLFRQFSDVASQSGGRMT